MTNRNADASQVEGGNNQPPAPPPGANDQTQFRGGNKVYKSGPLFLSSKGIGWTSWKKRWFILTRTSLVFFRSDPNAIQKGGEVNLILGGIDLYSSGSVLVKEDKKLLTVLFPDGRDGRAFTLKAETLEDLLEWKVALEEALANAPSAALVVGQNGMFRNDQANAVDVLLEQSKDRQPAKSLVIGRPVLLALEDIDGTPSFLEKALRFIEEHGVTVEGILRQAADVDDVEHRIREYEQGKSEFSPDEDAHVIADCVKYILRELPSSPVPASCCNALLEAFRTDRGSRVNAMRSAICETFPEPNRRLLQRILMMMQTIVSHKTENRMSTSAVAACMAPLLLRPLLAGDCELENDFDVGGDGSVQLLQAAAAANHAQAIVITLLEEYANLFGQGSVSPELYSDSDVSGSESEELSGDDESYEDDYDDDDAEEGSDANIDDDFDHESSATTSEVGENEDSNKVARSMVQSPRVSKSISKTPEVDSAFEADRSFLESPPQTSLQHDHVEEEAVTIKSLEDSRMQENESSEQLGAEPAVTSTSQKSTDVLNGPARNVRPPAVLGRTPAKKKLSMESTDIPFDDETEIQRLEATKLDLQNKIAEEVKINAILLEKLEKRKNAMHERRLALEKDVARLREQLQKERELRLFLQAGLKMSKGPLPVSSSIHVAMKEELEEIAQAEADVINLKQRADDLKMQLNAQRELNSRLRLDAGNQPQETIHYQVKDKDMQQDESNLTSKTLEESARNEHESCSKTDGDRDKKHEPKLSGNKHLPQRTTTSVVGGRGRTSSTSSRRSVSRNEGANTTSALSKLTNRIHFLKERRTQIANELQNFDKQNPGQPIQNVERGKSSEPRHSRDKVLASQGQTLEKGKPDSQQTLNHPEGQSLQNTDTGTKSEVLPNLDRGKSESFPNVEKGRAVVPPRTNSR